MKDKKKEKRKDREREKKTSIKRRKAKKGYLHFVTDSPGTKGFITEIHEAGFITH